MTVARYFQLSPRTYWFHITFTRVSNTGGVTFSMTPASAKDAFILTGARMEHTKLSPGTASTSLAFNHASSGSTYLMWHGSHQPYFPLNVPATNDASGYSTLVRGPFETPDGTTPRLAFSFGQSLAIGESAIFSGVVLCERAPPLITHTATNPDIVTVESSW